MTADGIMSTSEIIAFLDGYSAGERAGARIIRAWASTCQDASLRGALRVIELREQSHADLLAERVKELGGKATTSSDGVAADFYAYVGAADKTDADKLREIMRIVPPEQTIDRLEQDAARLAADQETQSLVRAIIEDERSTLWCLRAFATASAAA